MSGNNRSADRDKGSHTTGGNRWLRGDLTESVWGIAAKKAGNPLRDKFWRIAVKCKQKAVVAIAHHLLVLSYFVLQRGTPYEEKRGTPLNEEQRLRLIRHYIRRLGKLGIPLRGTLPAPSTQRPRRCKRVASEKQPTPS